MIKSNTRNILNRRPTIKFVPPRSVETIPVLEKSTIPQTTKETRVENIINSLNDVADRAEALEIAVSNRASNQILKLNLLSPEDAVVAQAAARLFPDKAKTIDGFTFVDVITFDMYHKCVTDVKAAGFEAGTKNQTKSTDFNAKKTDFGGLNNDRRPEVNNASLPITPLNIPAFIAAGIPVLFSMLLPLISAKNKIDIVAHTHPVVTPGVTGPGIPVIP